MEKIMTVKQLKEFLGKDIDDRIVVIERPDDNRVDNRYLDPTGSVDIDKDDEFFVIYTN